MPNYEYKCKSCDHRFEIWQSVGEAAPPCPACGAEVRKIFHAPPLHFKGSGFYVTDKASEKKAKTSDKAGETKSESAADSASTSSEAKTESKTETLSTSSDKTPAAS